MRAARDVRAGRGRHRGQPGLHPHLAGAVRRVVVGRRCRPCRPSWCCCPRGRRSTSTTGRAGPGRPSCRSPSWPRCARCARCRSTWPSCAPAPRPARPARGLIATGFTVLDKALKIYDRSPVKPGRAFAMRQAAEWIIARQEDDGGWGGIQPPWVYSILALHLLGYPLEHPVLSAAISGLDLFLVHEPTPDGHAAPARGLPVAGVGHLPGRHRAARLRRRRRRPGGAARGRLDAGRGDPQPRRLVGAPPGPRARRAGPSSSPTTATPTSTTPPRSCSRCTACQNGIPGVKAAIDRGIAWTVGMQSRDGGWARLRRRQHPAAGREAAVLRLRRGHRPAVGRRHRPRRRDARPLRHGRRRRRPAAACSGCSTRRRPTARGSAAGAPTTSTAPARSCPALVVGRGRPRRRRRSAAPSTGSSSTRTTTAAGVRTCAPTSTTAWRGRGASTASQTAWALLALLAVDAAHRGRRARDRLPRRHPARRRRLGRGRCSPAPASPGDFYINYEMYRVVFPLSALGRYLDLVRNES